MFTRKSCETLAILLAVPFMFLASPSAASGQECLACHGQPGMKSEKGENLSIDPAKHGAGAHSVLACQDCHTSIRGYPHPEKTVKVQCSTCHADESHSIAKSAHSALGADACQACHGNVHELKAGELPGHAKCSECHAEEVKDFPASIHGQAAASGDRYAPNCQSCHGPVHKILPSGDAASLVSRKNLPNTCATCHSNLGFLSRHNIPMAHPVEFYRQSVHGRAVAAGKNAATCSDCHGSHAIFPARDSRAKVNHWVVADTCGACHTEIAKTYKESVHGQAVLHGSMDAPVCTDCHGEHNILAPAEPGSSVNPARVSSVTCGRCHGDERINARYNLPADRVPTFADSYHGLESRSGGQQTVANCASCHGIHNIFPTSDPRSMVNAANLAHTCGNCHPGAGERFAIGPVHVRSASQSEHPVVKWIRRTYWVLIPLAIGFMFIHQLLDYLRKLLRKERRVDSGEEVMRMNLNFRIAHWLTVVSFPVLVVTGFALKFPEAWWARPMLHWENYFAFRGTVHRIAAVVLLAALAYHTVHLILVRRDRAILHYMMPGLGDLRDLGDLFLFNLGLSETRPMFGKFNYVEKIEYLAYMWGTVVMAATGFILWFNNLALRYFPKWVSDAATALHFYEAILATFSILIWHMYTVVFDPDVYPMDRAWLTGRTSADHLRHTRPAYYAELRKQQQSSGKSSRDIKNPPEET